MSAPALRERHRDALPEPRVCAGNQRDFAFERERCKSRQRR